jgi:hypothetical protein
VVAGRAAAVAGRAVAVAGRAVAVADVAVVAAGSRPRATISANSNVGSTTGPTVGH